MKLTKSMEDYLEAVLFLDTKNDGVRMTDISDYLNVKKPSANKAIKKLEEKGYVTHETYGKVILTASGVKQANKIKEKHFLLFKFLKEVLGVNHKAAEIDACKLEHAVSEETSDKLKEFLEFIADPKNFNEEYCRDCFIRKVKS